MMPELQPLGGSNPAHSFAYFGDRADWLVALTRHRDSDALERSNWDVISSDLLARFPDDAAIERFSHWAVGWTESLLIRPGTDAAIAAKEWRARLDDYPVANEDHYSELEYAEEWCIRCDRGTRDQHPLPGCPFRSADDADEIRARWERRNPPLHGYRRTRDPVGPTLWDGA